MSGMARIMITGFRSSASMKCRLAGSACICTCVTSGSGGKTARVIEQEGGQIEAGIAAALGMHGAHQRAVDRPTQAERR